jgi:tetratricopeptide (TPR) repeat protein
MRQVQQAVSIAQSGDPTRALDLTNALLARHPDFVPALKLQGSLLEDMGREADAVPSYEKALALAPNDPDLLFKVGVYQLVTGHYDQAVTLLRHHLRLEPRDSDALYYLAQAYHLIGSNDLALTAIEQCLHLDPNNVAVWQKYGELLCSSGNNESALKWLQKAQHSDPTLDRIDFDLGVASYNNMDLANALAYASEAVRRRSNDAEALALLAAIQVKLSQWQNGKSTFERILQLKPNDLTSLLGLGHCQVELREFQPAVDTLERVVQIDPTQVLAHFYLSRAFAGLGKMAEAQQEAELHNRMMQQLSIGSSAEDVERENAVWNQARQFLIDHHEEEARRLFEQSSTGEAATPGSSFVLIGALYLSIGDPDDALRNLRRALQVEPAVRGAHTYMGILALQQGDLLKAESEFKTELARHPNYLTALAELGEVRYRQARWSEAVDEFTKSKTTNPAFMYMLCDAYYHLGRKQDAAVTAEALAAYSRNNPQVIDSLINLVNRNGDTVLAQRISSTSKP